MDFLGAIIGIVLAYTIIKQNERSNSYPLILCISSALMPYLFINKFQRAEVTWIVFGISIAGLYFIHYKLENMSREICAIDTRQNILAAIIIYLVFAYLVSKLYFNGDYSSLTPVQMVGIAGITAVIYYLLRSVVFDYFTLWMIYLFGKEDYYYNQQMTLTKKKRAVSKLKGTNFSYKIDWYNNDSKIKLCPNRNTILAYEGFGNENDFTCCMKVRKLKFIKRVIVTRMWQDEEDKVYRK